MSQAIKFDPNILTTENGYMYTQQANGWFTDGDVEFDPNNTDIFGLVWRSLDGIYCADGDGLVTVETDGQGQWIVSDQGEMVSKHEDMQIAFMAAQSVLAANYPIAYEDNIE